MEKNKEITGRFKTALESRRFKTQKVAAAVLGITEGYLSQLLAGKRIPSDMLLNVMELKLRIRASWILTGEGEMNTASQWARRTREAIWEIEQTESIKGALPKTETFDPALMTDVIEAVEDVFEAEKLYLPPRKKAELIMLIYEETAGGAIQRPELRGKIVKFARLAS